MTRTIIASRIRFYRTARGWSQRTLAAQMDASQGLIDRYERALIDIPTSRMVQMAALFDCTMDDLCSETPAPLEVTP